MLVAFTAGEGERPVSLYDWHRRMDTIVDTAEGAVTGVILEDSPDNIPKLDSSPSCALTKARHTIEGRRNAR